MIAYNKTWLANLRLQQQVKNHGEISDSDFKGITEKYPVSFYMPNIFVRVGLFILTSIIVLFVDGLLSLMAADSGMIESAGWFIFLGSLSYGGLEVMVISKDHYRSGVDDALLFTTGGLFTISFYLIMGNGAYHIDLLAFSTLVCLLTLYFTLRFGDMLASAVCYGSFLWMIFLFWMRFGGLPAAPFIMMLIGGATYWLARKYCNDSRFINYDNCLNIVQILSLLALYAAGNYYAINTLSAELMHQTGPVAFGFFFWIWTIAMPFVYIGFGIKQKNRILLRIGLLLVVAAILTFRNYYHLLQVDVMLTIAGVLVLALVYAISKYLKTPKYGFTNLEPDDINTMDSLKIESLIVAETFSYTPAAPSNDGVKFGGGDFGGGGSGSTF